MLVCRIDIDELSDKQGKRRIKCSDHERYHIGTGMLYVWMIADGLKSARIFNWQDEGDQDSHLQKW